MPLASMTGFSRAEGFAAGLNWAFELRSVNGKGLEIRLRLPSGFEAIEPAIRDLLAKTLKRGSVFVGLEVQLGAGAQNYRINREFLMELAALTRDTAVAVGGAPPPLESLFAVRGVIESVDARALLGDNGLKEADLMATLGQALGALIEARQNEGAKLAVVLGELVDAMEALVFEARDLAALRPEKLKVRLMEQLEMLLDAERRLPEDKLAQEVALLLVRFDVREEIDRLVTHLAQIRALLAEGSAAGRRLDFLAQELNREISTLCAKSSDTALTRIGLDLKLAVDQFREQALNLE